MVRQPGLYKIEWYKWITDPITGKKVAGPRHTLPKLYKKRAAKTITERITKVKTLSYTERAHVAYASLVSGSDFSRPHMRNPGTRKSTLALRLFTSLNEWRKCKTRRKELIYGLIYAARAVYAAENGWKNVPEIENRQRKERLPNNKYVLKYLGVWYLYKDCQLPGVNCSLQQALGREWKEINSLLEEYLGKEFLHEQDYRPNETIPEDYYAN